MTTNTNVIVWSVHLDAGDDVNAISEDELIQFGHCFLHKQKI